MLGPPLHTQKTPPPPPATEELKRAGDLLQLWAKEPNYNKEQRKRIANPKI